MMLNIALLAMLSCTFFSSCSDDDEKNGGFSGVYTNVDGFIKSVEEDIDNGWIENDGRMSGQNSFYFNNSNTVEKIVIYAYTRPKSNAICTKTIRGKTIYFVKTESRGLYSYVIKDNRIYITSGDIGPVSNNSFYLDGRRYSRLN